MRRALILLCLAACAASAADDWGPVQALIGTWVGEGSGQPGNGAGEFSFSADLQNKILVRKSYADYPAQAGRPAFRHDDLMIVYRDEASHDLRAIYFDSESHVIHYSVSAGGPAVVFTSDGKPAEMRYRLTYTPSGNDSLKLKFEIAQPGKEFAPYIDASMRRK